MKREDTDFFVVYPHHLAIHDLLMNWSRYVGTGKGGLTGASPMFRGYRSSEVWSQECSLPIDELAGHAMEKEVGKLPEKNRDAIRWHYVFWRIPPGRMCRYLGVGRADLAGLIHDGRSMLKNRA